jgi:hypothetical protein
MNSPSAGTPALPLGPATIAATQRTVIDALPPRLGASEAEKADQRKGALEFLAAPCPRNPLRAMLAARIVTSHYAAMECFRSAARDDLPVALYLRTAGKAIALCRMLEVAMRDLARHQGGVVGQPAFEATRPSAPQPPSLEGRHARHLRERAERDAAAAARRAGPDTNAADSALQQRLQVEVAARQAMLAPRPAAAGQRQDIAAMPGLASGGFGAPPPAQLAQLAAELEGRLSVSAAALAA